MSVKQALVMWEQNYGSPAQQHPTGAAVALDHLHAINYPMTYVAKTIADHTGRGIGDGFRDAIVLTAIEVNQGMRVLAGYALLLGVGLGVGLVLARWYSHPSLQRLRPPSAQTLRPASLQRLRQKEADVLWLEQRPVEPPHVAVEEQPPKSKRRATRGVELSTAGSGESVTTHRYNLRSGRH